MADLSEFVGLPFAPKGRSVEGADCWGLVRIVYMERLGIFLPSYAEEYEVGEETQEKAIMRHKNEWMKVEAPQAYDIVLLRQGGKQQHVGVIADWSWMLHTTEHTGAVLERYRDRKWEENLLGFYRLP